MIDSATIELLSGKFIIGLLIFIRISGMFVSAPFFRGRNIQTKIKILLAVILTVITTSIYWDKQPVIDFHPWYLVFLVMKEFMVGVAIGFSANAVFYAARLGGGLIDFEIGFQTSLMFMSEDAPTLVGELKELVVLMIFIFLNGHHFLIEAMYASLQAVPLTFFQVTESTVVLLTKMVASVMIIGLKISAPVLMALFIANLSLVLLARVAPQTNIFALSFQLRIVIGLLAIFVSIPLFVMVAKYSLETMQAETMKILLSLNPARV